MQIINRHKKYLLFVITLIALGILAGVLYYYFLESQTKEEVLNTISNFNNFRYNAILKDLTIMSLLLISSFFIIGIPFSFFYLFYEGISFGFLLNIFYLTFKIKGIIYILIYFIINKFLTLLLMFIFILKCTRISRYMVGAIIYPKETPIKEKIFNSFKSNLYVIVFIFIINVILYFTTPFIFNKLTFLIK